jgi:two-component system sensor histidine kinase DegS
MTKATYKFHFKLVLLFAAFQTLCFGQKEQDSLLAIWQNTKVTDSTRVNAYSDYIRLNYLESKTDSAYAMALNLMDFVNEHQLKKQKADVLILLGDIEHIFNNNTEASKNFNASLKIYEEIDYKRGQAMALNGIGVCYRKVFNLDEAKTYYEKSLEISRRINDTLLMAKSLMSIGNIYGWRYKSDESLGYYSQSLKLIQSINNKREESVVLINIGDFYIIKKDFNNAKMTIDRVIEIADSLENYNILSHAYGVLGRSYFQQKEYDKIIEPAHKMEAYAKKISKTKGLDGAYYLLFEAYRGKKDFDSTMKYHALRKLQRTTLDDIKSVRSLEKIKVDNTRTKDSLVSTNMALKSEMAYQKEKSNLTLAWGGSLSALSILALIVYRNTKRKQRKAEKERQQQIEEKEKILKDLELSTINAMIEGQEKERQRLALDLHDSAGATLSAAKLQFDFLIKNQNDAKYSEELIKKMSTLLEDAYVEVRSMAHLKNSGVIAKNGLLPAVKKLASNASGANGLIVEVQSFGLENRLENSLEISIFRIIQELVTNIIKHANATTGTVHLTNHNYILNIMVEDNGIGFNPKQITKIKAGMGISSIDKRVEHLDGTLTIESENNKGTTVIIDIPL